MTDDLQAASKEELSYLEAELEVTIAKAILEEARDELFYKGLDLVAATLRKQQEQYVNGILHLCRTGKQENETTKA